MFFNNYIYLGAADVYKRRVLLHERLFSPQSNIFIIFEDSSLTSI